MIRTMPLQSPAGSHPFRDSLRFIALKQKVRQGQRHEPRSARFSMQDLREFLMAYCACFLAVSTFIA